MSTNPIRYINSLILITGLILLTTAWGDPLQEAAEANDVSRVTELISQGVPINAKDGSGRTALYWASQEDHMPVVELLIDRGADIDSPSTGDDGWTPLIIAAYRGNDDIAGYLLEHGANINAMDKYGYTALSWAWGKHHLTIVRLLLTRGASANVPPVAYGEGPPKGKGTLLHRAVSTGEDEALIKLLIDNGADVNAKDGSGRTPLHMAVDRGRLATVKLLVESGADLTAKAKGGIYTGKGFLVYSQLTPLELANLYEKYVPGPRRDIMKFLGSRSEH